MSNSTNSANMKDDVQDTATIRALITALDSDDGQERQRARRRLVSTREPAIAPLINLLANSSSDRARWEAAKALAQIKDSVAAPALVTALEDENSGIRWVAADGLILLGRAGAVPLLKALVQRSESVWLREGAHHVFHAMVREGMGGEAKPVLAALEDIEPSIEVPAAAQAALHALTG